MKVFSVVDNSPPKKTSKKGSKGKARSSKRKVTKQPPRKYVSADQILSKVEAFSAKNIDQAKMTKAKLAKFNAQKLPDLDDADKEAHKGDVGINDPNDLATHGKLKQVLSMNAFSFSDKEKAALEKILKD